jgi:hypothetical protein
MVYVIFKHHLDNAYLIRLARVFSLDSEMNVPTFYSSLALLFCATLLIIISVSHKRSGKPSLAWLFLAIIFTFLSIDEISTLHEKLIDLSREAFNASGVFYYAWVIPYGAALVVFLVVYFRFLLSLPKKIMILFIVSGSIFVLGALGMELVGGLHTELHGTNNWTYSLMTTFEELLEMVGIVIFIYTLLTYIVEQLNILTITLKPSQQGEK